MLARGVSSGVRQLRAGGRVARPTLTQWLRAIHLPNSTQKDISGALRSSGEVECLGYVPLASQTIKRTAKRPMESSCPHPVSLSIRISQTPRRVGVLTIQNPNRIVATGRTPMCGQRFPSRERGGRRRDRRAGFVGASVGDLRDHGVVRRVRNGEGAPGVCRHELPANEARGLNGWEGTGGLHILATPMPHRPHHQLRSVHVLGTGSFLPGPPVTVDEIDSRLGGLADAPEAVRKFSSGACRRLAEHSGVHRRHFAIAPETGQLTHDFAGLAREACVRALEQARVEPDEVDLLVVSMPGVDDFTPPTSATLQAELGIERCTEIAIHSNCSGVGKAVQIALDAIRVGRCRTALVAYSQLSSVFLRSAWLAQPAMTKSQALMRWILSDGAGALVLRGVDDPHAPGHELVEAHASSIGGRLPPAMTCGLGARSMRVHQVALRGLAELGLHHLDQDFAAVSAFSATRLEELLLGFANALQLTPGDIDHYILSIPTVKLYDDARARIGYLPWERCPFRCGASGYCGGAAILVHLDEMARSGALQPGQLAMCYSVESSKWMGGGFLVRW